MLQHYEVIVYISYQQERGNLGKSHFSFCFLGQPDFRPRYFTSYSTRCHLVLFYFTVIKYPLHNFILREGRGKVDCLFPSGNFALATYTKQFMSAIEGAQQSCLS